MGDAGREELIFLFFFRQICYSQLSGKRIPQEKKPSKKEFSTSPAKNIEKKIKTLLDFFKKLCILDVIKSGCSAAWLARLTGGQKVVSSILIIPTIFFVL